MTAAARDEGKITRVQKTVYCLDGHEYPTLEAAAEVAADDDLGRIAATLGQSMLDLPIQPDRVAAVARWIISRRALLRTFFDEADRAVRAASEGAE